MIIYAEKFALAATQYSSDMQLGKQTNSEADINEVKLQTTTDGGLHH